MVKTVLNCIWLLFSFLLCLTLAKRANQAQANLDISGNIARSGFESFACTKNFPYLQLRGGSPDAASIYVEQVR